MNNKLTFTTVAVLTAAISLGCGQVSFAVDSTSTARQQTLAQILSNKDNGAEHMHERFSQDSALFSSPAESVTEMNKQEQMSIDQLLADVPNADSGDVPSSIGVQSVGKDENLTPEQFLEQLSPQENDQSNSAISRPKDLSSTNLSQHERDG